MPLYSPAFQVSLQEPYLQRVSGVGQLSLYIVSSPGDVALDPAELHWPTDSWENYWPQGLRSETVLSGPKDN